MMLIKLKEFLVRLILNDPDFSLSKNSKTNDGEKSSDNKTEANEKSATSEKQDTTAKAKDVASNKSDSAKNIPQKKQIFNINIYLGIAVILSFAFYIIAGYANEHNRKLNIEYNAYFSEIDMTERTTQSPFPININTASVEEIMQLPDIGSSKAKLIVEYRLENDGFKEKEELLNISGIGEITFEKIKDLIIIS